MKKVKEFMEKPITRGDYVKKVGCEILVSSIAFIVLKLILNKALKEDVDYEYDEYEELNEEVES